MHEHLNVWGTSKLSNFQGKTRSPSQRVLAGTGSNITSSKKFYHEGGGGRIGTVRESGSTWSLLVMSGDLDI